ncbi:MAG: hypothetical protein U0744_02770 [Gemmataceae bacterium]
MFDLAEEETDPRHAERYRAAANTMLETLCTKFLADRTPEWEGILLHGVYHLHKNLGVHESVAWGDHFFVEALVSGSQASRKRRGRKEPSPRVSAADPGDRTIIAN